MIDKIEMMKKKTDYNSFACHNNSHVNHHGKE